MNGSDMNRSVTNLVCFEWSVMNRSILKGNRRSHVIFEINHKAEKNSENRFD